MFKCVLVAAVLPKKTNNGSNLGTQVPGEVLDIGAATESLAAVIYHTVDKIMP